MAQRISYTSYDGLDLVAYSYGPIESKLTILCLHGLTRNHKDFEPMIAGLNSDYRFIAVDTRGRGESAYDPDPYHYTTAIYARDMVTLLDELDLKKVVLIGTSMGGLISMTLMKTIPERILGVVLNDIGPTVNKRGIARISSYVGKSKPFSSWEEAAVSVAKLNAVAFPHFAEADWMAVVKRACRELDDGSIVFDYDPLIYKPFRRNRIKLLTNYFAWRLFDSMSIVPMLLIRGALSDILTRHTAKRMLRRHGNASLVTVENVGHAPLLNEPIAVEAITRFLAQFEPRR